MIFKTTSKGIKGGFNKDILFASTNTGIDVGSAGLSLQYNLSKCICDGKRSHIKDKLSFWLKLAELEDKAVLVAETASKLVKHIVPNIRPPPPVIVSSPSCIILDLITNCGILFGTILVVAVIAPAPFIVCCVICDQPLITSIKHFRILILN